MDRIKDFPGLQYFLDYVTYDTRSDESSESWPSTAGQLRLAERLLDDLRALGLRAERDENGYVMGWLPANTRGAAGAELHQAAGEEAQAEALTLGLIAHMDTAPDMIGPTARPRVLLYEGGDIELDAAAGIVLSPAVFPKLEKHIGKHLVVTDGHSLLGADDKAGVAAIMALLRRFHEQPELPHGPIAVAFTPDEEIGRGAHRFNVARFGAQVAYTIDGSTEGELEYENFNAAAAKIYFSGRNVHPGTAKGKMINAGLLARDFASLLSDRDTPQATEGHEGFYHLTNISGTVEEAKLSYIIRDFDREAFEARKQHLRDLVARQNAGLDKERIRIDIQDQYFNMKEIIERHPFLIEQACSAMRLADVEPLIKAIRGGTDGSQLSFASLPCPNLFTGGENYHGRYEYLVVETFAKLIRTLEELCGLFSTLTVAELGR